MCLAAPVFGPGGNVVCAVVILPGSAYHAADVENLGHALLRVTAQLTGQIDRMPPDR